MRRYLLLVPLFALSAQADEPAGSKLPPEPKPIMCQKGELLLEDSYTGGKHGKEWFRITGTFVVENDQLKAAEGAEDKHHSELSTGVTGPLKANDFVIRFSFKFDGAKSLSVGLENPKGHVARCGGTADSFGISKWNGKKDSLAMKFEPGVWHTVLWEVHGSEMVAQIDDRPPLYVQDDSLNVEKPRFVLTNYGQFAWFDDVRIWKAEPSPDWPARREKLKAERVKPTDGK